jgi:hypothetical protein
LAATGAARNRFPLEMVETALMCEAGHRH